MRKREDNIDKASRDLFDVAIIGGGINGACLYHRLCSEGYRVALIEKGDFASGTSQASAMMVWGGLLYLGSMDFPAVYSFSSSRDKMIRDMAEWVSPCLFRFLPARHGLLSKGPVVMALYLYWLISHFRRNRPRIEKRFLEKDLLNRENVSLLFEEGKIDPSDARFVLHWITRNARSACTALNYCELVSGEFQQSEHRWHLSVRDRVAGREMELRARSVVNCAGVWTDRVNENFGIRSPYKHVCSKGVYLGMARGVQQAPLIFDMGEHNDVITSIPWGPIRLWGPTETAIRNIDGGFSASPEDIRFLLEHYADCYRQEATREDIVSIRCGIRPLAVSVDYDRDDYPLELSRRSRVAVDGDRRWVSVYGSKLTGCENLARKVAHRLHSVLPVPGKPSCGQVPAQQEAMPVYNYPGLDDKMPTLEWCMENEYCCTLEDYLRRRTNIAQWVPREGLGLRDEHLPALRELCLKLSHGDQDKAEQQLAAYRDGVVKHFDRVLEHV